MTKPDGLPSKALIAAAAACAKDTTTKEWDKMKPHEQYRYLHRASKMLDAFHREACKDMWMNHPLLNAIKSGKDGNKSRNTLTPPSAMAMTAWFGRGIK